MSQQLLRQLPQIEKLLQLPAARAAGGEASRSAVVAAARGVVESLRAEILTGRLDDQDLKRRLETERLEASFRRELRRVTESAYGRVINATGVILHTGLGRAVLPRVPSRGSVGASGDLAPLAHLALPLVGEGAAEVDGELLPGAEPLATTA